MNTLIQSRFSLQSMPAFFNRTCDTFVVVIVTPRIFVFATNIYIHNAKCTCSVSQTESYAAMQLQNSACIFSIMRPACDLKLKMY